jgi:signal transduction histidine kinase
VPSFLLRERFARCSKEHRAFSFLVIERSTAFSTQLLIVEQVEDSDSRTAYTCRLRTKTHSHMSEGDPSNPQVDQADPDVSHSLLDLVYRNALLASFIVMAVSATLCWMHRDQTPIASLAAWMAFMSAVSIGRYVLSRAYFAAHVTNADVPKWRMRFRIGLTLSSVGWFATLYLFMPQTSQAHQFATGMVLAGMAAGGVAVLSADRVSFYIHTCFTVVAGGIFMLLQGTQLAFFFGVLGLLVGLGLARGANYTHSVIVDALVLAIQKSQLANQLVAANDVVAKNNARLEAEIAERRRIEAALIQARDEADVANRAKSTFLANMSHELRTPLNGVIGAGELLSLTTLDEEQERYTKVIRSSSETLLGVISDVLDFSKLDAGRMTAHAETVALRAVLASCVDMVRLGAHNKSLHLHAEIEDNVPQNVVTDGVKLRQILLNFLSNAVKFTDRGGVTLHASFERETFQTGALTVTVTDTGIGMSEHTLSQPFKPFTQADASATRRHGGTGLGLVIAEQLIKLLNGKLKVNSQEGVGTTVQVTLPMQIAS